MKQHESSQGHDSFLDIVANLVGILIILVVIVGAQAANVWQQAVADESPQANLVELQSELQRRKNEATSVRNHNAELRDKIKYQQRINRQLFENRNTVLVAIETQKRKLAEDTKRLSEEQAVALELQSKVDGLQYEIEQVRYEFNAAEHLAKPSVKQIDHYPTPIAKTVFAEEIHFQIRNQRVSYVPMDELIDAMKGEWKVKANKLKVVKNTWESVGPIENFRLRYLLHVTQSPQAPSQYGIRFGHFEIQPMSKNLGEEIAVALSDGSQFDQKIRRKVPRKTTVTFWVYPDSYNELLELRSDLREQGFQIASWPLNFGQSINGGPSGFRSSTN